LSVGTSLSTDIQQMALFKFSNLKTDTSLIEHKITEQEKKTDYINEFFALVDTNNDENIQRDELLEIVKIFNPGKDLD